MYTPGYEGRVPNFTSTDARHLQLKRAVDLAGARSRAAGPLLDEARTALLTAVTTSVAAQIAFGNVASTYVALIRESNDRSPKHATKVPACTEELDAVVAKAFATFAAARKEFDDAAFALREANSAFGQHLGQSGR